MKARDTTAIVNAVILRPGVPPARGGLLISGKRIERLLGEGESPPPSAAAIDAGGCFLCPGFIDLHVHGGGGDVFLQEGGRRLTRIIDFLARFGVTSLLPTISAAPRGQLLRLVGYLAPYCRGKQGDGRVLGLNLEGPYLNVGQRGAQPLRFIRLPSRAETEEILEAAEGAVRIMTLAPELEGALPLIRLLKRAGVIAAAGHTAAGYETTRSAIRAGLSYATHIYNSYPVPHHRHPGAIGALLESEKVRAEFICDGVHLSPPVVRLLLRIKPLDDLILVTDGVEVMGRRTRRFLMGGREVTVEGGGARLPDETLVGSLVPMNRALHNLAEWTGLPLEEAIRPATLNPARLLGLADRKGDLRPGMDADLLLLDRRFEIRRTVIAGRTVFSKKSR